MFQLRQQCTATYRQQLQDVRAHPAACTASQGVQQQEGLQRVTLLHGVTDLIQDLQSGETDNSGACRPCQCTASSAEQTVCRTCRTHPQSTTTHGPILPRIKQNHLVQLYVLPHLLPVLRAVHVVAVRPVVACAAHVTDELLRVQHISQGPLRDGSIYQIHRPKSIGKQTHMMTRVPFRSHSQWYTMPSLPCHASCHSVAHQAGPHLITCTPTSQLYTTQVRSHPHLEHLIDHTTLHVHDDGARLERADGSPAVTHWQGAVRLHPGVDIAEEAARWHSSVL